MITYGIGDKIGAAPRLSLIILKIAFPAFGLDERQGFPIRISALPTDDIAKELCHTENIIHDLTGIFEYIDIDSLKNVKRLILSPLQPAYKRHTSRDMTFPKWFHITALRAKSKCVQRILQCPAVHSLDFSASRKNHLAGLHSFLGLNGTVGLYDAAQPHMSAVPDDRIMIHHPRRC